MRVDELFAAWREGRGKAGCACVLFVRAQSWGEGLGLGLVWKGCVSEGGEGGEGWSRERDVSAPEIS